MLIEFSGPAASGKTTFVRNLLCEIPDARPVLRSASPSGKRPMRQLWTATMQLHHFPSAFINAHKWYRATCDNDKASMRASFQMALEYCTYKAASNDRKIWLLDQGALQFGSRFSQSAWRNPTQEVALYQKATWIGDGVVIISMPPELSLSRIVERGGGGLLEQTAKKRGFSSSYEFLEKNLELQKSRIDLAVSLNKSVLHIFVSERDPIDLTFYRPTVCVERRVDPWLEAIGRSFMRWWKL